MPAAGEGGRRGSLPGGAGRFPGVAVPVPPVRICVIGSPPLPPALNKYFSRISLNSAAPYRAARAAGEQGCCLAGTERGQPQPPPCI